MAVRHLGELKKKKILWSLSCSRDSRIHLRCRCTFLANLGGLDTGKPPASGREDPGGRAAAASHSPRRGRRAVPGARGGPAAGGPPPGPSAPRPGPSGPRFHPGTYKASLGASRGPRRTEQGEKAPHLRASAYPLPQPHPDRHWERRGAGPPPPPVSAAPPRGRPRASGSPPARQPHPRRRPPRTPAGAALPVARLRAAAPPRPAPLGSASPGHRRSSP